MKPLREIVSDGVYDDTEHFSDQVLLPAIANGHHLKVVTAFVPSYLYRLFNDIATSPEIEPGRIDVVFCIPLASSEGVPLVRVLSKYLSALAENSSEMKKVLMSMKILIKEGGLKLGALVSTENTLITPSCLAIIESGEFGSSDYCGMVDAVAGDLNSPIEVESTWSESNLKLPLITHTVMKGFGGTIPGLVRLSNNQVAELVSEILQKGYPRQDLIDRDKLLPGAKGTKSSSTSFGKKSKSKHKKHLSDLDDFFDDDFEFDEDEFGSDYNIDRILTEVNLRETWEGEEDVAAFLGMVQLEKLFMDSAKNRKHTPPLPEDILEVIGQLYATCWCGEEFERGQGCPEHDY